MTRDELFDMLSRLRACGDSRIWVASLPQETIARQAWETCQRSDWLIWLAARVGVDRRQVVLAACDCAETALAHVEPDFLPVSMLALHAARRWARGEGEPKELLTEVRAARAAVWSVVADAAAAEAAAYAASTVACAADDAAAYAADAAACAAAAADADAGRQASLARSADLVRARISWDDVAARLEEVRP